MVGFDHRVNLSSGLHIYMGGVGLQEVFIICFIGLAVRFQRQMRTETPMQDKPRALRLLYVVYAVLVLITVRLFPPTCTSNGPPSLTLSPDPYHIPPSRILPRHHERHSPARSIPIRFRLDSHAHLSRPLQCHSPRSTHAWKRVRLP